MKFAVYLILSLLSLPLGLSSCLKVDEKGKEKDYPEFIVFGTFQDPDNCFSNLDQCINIYKIDAAGLFEDADSNTPEEAQALMGNFNEQKSINAYINIEELFANNPIPQDLLDRPSGTVGTAPTWANNFYLEYKTPEGYKHWIIDGSFDGSLPSSIQQYINILSQATNIAFQG